MNYPRKKNPNTLQQKKPDPFYKYTSMAVKMIVVVVVFSFGGYKLDEVLALEFPVFTLAGSLLGTILAIYSVIRDLLK